MLSTSISAADTRRRLHRRQNSTPITEMPYIPSAHPGIQRAQQIQHLRGHRRGLSLDQRASFTPTQRLVPSLGPISSSSQDDMSLVSTHSTNHPGTTTPTLQHSHPLQFAQHAELVQPGLSFSNLDAAQAQAQFQLQQQQFTQSLDADPPLYFPPPQQQTQGHQFPQPTSSPQLLQQAAFRQQMAMAAHSAAEGPTTLAAAKRQLEACFPGMNINIQVLPTPVATPQKRPSISSPEKFEISPVSLTLNDGDSLALEPNQALQPVYSMPMFDTSLGQAVPGASFDGQLHSPHAISPTRSFIGSPLHQAMSPSQASTLLEIEGDPSSHMGSPLGSNPVSFADLSVQEMKGAFVTTGVAPEEVDKYISAQDPSSRKYFCLYEGCTKNEGFGRRENIRAHVQTHLNDRAYRCLICNSAFVRLNDLKRHSKIHKDKKEFQCECGSMFARHDALTRHKQRGCCSVHSSPLKANKKKPGRPKKHRPELDDRMAKSARQRELNATRKNNEDLADPESEGSASEGERSPSPDMDRTEFASFDEVEAPLGSSQTLAEEEDCSGRSGSPVGDEVKNQKSNLTFDGYAENTHSMSMNGTFDVNHLDVDNMDDYLSVSNASTYPSSVMNYLSSNNPSAIMSSTSTATNTSHTAMMRPSMGGLGITHSTPPPDHPSVNSKLLRSELPKASPTHSLCNSLSTPPSSPPEMLHNLQVFGLGDDMMTNKFWDFESPIDSKPSNRIDWDDVDADLFGDELPSSTRTSVEDFLDLY